MRQVFIGVDGQEHPIIGDGKRIPFQTKDVDVDSQETFEAFVLAIAEDIPEGVVEFKWDETVMQMCKTESQWTTVILHGASEFQDEATIEKYVGTADYVARNRPY